MEKPNLYNHDITRNSMIVSDIAVMASLCFVIK